MTTSRKLFMAFLAEAALFILASISFFQGWQILCTDLYDFSHMLMVMPMFLSYTVMIYWLLSIRSLMFKTNPEKKAKALFVHSIIYVALGAVLEVLILINIIVGNYVFGWVNPIFPIDLILINAVMIAAGLLGILKKEVVLNVIPSIELEGKVAKPLMIVGGIFGGLYVVVQEYLFGGLLLSQSFIDQSTDTVVATIPLFLLCLLGALLLANREIVIFLSAVEKPSKIKRIIFGGVLTALVLVFSGIVLYLNFAASSQYIVLNLQGFFVLDYIASLNLAPYMVTIPSILYCAVLAIKFFFTNK